MTDFFARFYPGDAAALGAAVVMLQIAAVIGLAAGAARWLARGAAARHAVWLGALGCVLISPIVAIAAARLGLALLRIELSGGPPAVEARQDGAWAESVTVPALETLPSTGALRPESGTQAPPVVGDQPPAAPAEATTPPAPMRSDAGGAIVASVDAARPADAWRALLGAASLAWAAGAVFLLLRLLHGRCVLARWRRAARPADARRLAGVLDAVRSGLGVRNLPPILISPLAAGPSAVGVLHPCVLLPEGLIDSLDDHQLRDVLIHECAHALRRDPFIGLLQRLAEAVFWPHLLVHYLNRRLARAREEVCDDYVLRAGDARAYARTLLTLAAGGVRLPLGTPGLFGSNWKLEDRVAGLLDPRRTPMTRVNPWTAAGLAAVLLAACIAGAAVRPAEPAGEKAAANKDKESDAPPDVSKAIIEGVVVDEDGKPVAGAVVGVLRATPERPTARTAADGSFRLALDTASVYQAVVVASAEDGERQGIYEFQGTSFPRTAQARIVLKPSRKMAVRVTDAAKTPVEDAAVGVLDHDSGMLLARAETDAHGLVTLRLPSDAHIEQVVALKPQVGFDYFENYRDSPPSKIDEPPAQLALTLDGARTLSVRAVDSADKPLPGVELVPWSVKKKGKLFYVNFSGLGAMKYVSARTDRDGLAAFEWIPPELEEGVTVLYGGEEYSLPEAPNQDPKPPYQTLTAKLFRMTPISGKVTRPDGKPAAGVLLQVEGRGDTGFYFRSFVRTSADGAYSLLVYPNQSYMIGVTDEDWAAASKTGVVVKEGEPREGLDFHLGKGTMLRGKVTVGPDHKPAAKEGISLGEQGADIAPELAGKQEKRETLWRWVETDSDGRYAIRLGPGRYQISGWTQQPWGEVTVKDEETIDKDFHVDRLDILALLKGTVRQEATDGKPVGGAIVQVQAYMSVRYEAVADDKGRFEMERKNNKALLYARNAEGTRAALVPVGADDAQATPVLIPAGKLTGRILDIDGKPMANVRVSCGCFIPPEDDPNMRFDLSAETDDAGRFTINGVVPGTRCTFFAFKGPKYSKQLKEVPSAPEKSLDLGDLVFDLSP